MKKTFKLLTGLALATAMALPMAASADKITLGTEGAYAPFNGIDKDGKVFGFDVDIGNALCKAMNAECTWVTQEWDGMIPALKAKKYDAIIASMTINDERKQQIDFTDKYYTSPLSFVRLIGSGHKVSKKGIKGKIIGVQSGTVAERFVNEAYGDSVEVKSYATQDEANLDLVAGRVDLVAADTFVVFPFASDAKNNAEYVGDQIADPKYVGEGIGIGIRKGEDELRERLNKALKQILADGTYKKINAKYFPFDVYGE